ncbi:hypothetical protein E0494_04555 [Marinilabiliaceae bacterium JC040]|nr:hypothetical protein [Marinilabiliaceae bacterium JC040]
MTEILNSHQYYKLSENESSEYEFTTDNKVKYKVTFMEYGGDFYHFAFDRVDGYTNSTKDEKIKNTIIYAIKTFLLKREEAIVIICESLDGKHFARFRLFNWWFNSIEDKEQYSKKDFNEYYDDTKIHVYASCFIRRNNPNKDKLLNSFPEYINQQF